MSARAAGCLLFSAVLLTAGLMTGGQPYYLGALILLLAILFALLSCIWVKLTLKVSVSGEKDRAVRQDTIPLLLRTRHTCPIGAGSIRLTVTTPGDRENSPLSVSGLPFRTGEYRYNIRCAHRGIYECGVTGAAVSDVFGFFTLHKKIRSAGFILKVSPRRTRIRALEVKPGDVGQLMHVQMEEDAFSPSGVRDYREGDPLKKVHWKLSLKRGSVMVRTYDEAARPDTLILLDLSPIDAVRGAALEIEDALCEAALNIAAAQLESEYPVRMPLYCSTPMELAGMTAADLPAITDALTSVRFDAQGTFDETILQMQSRRERTGAMALITSRLTPVIADEALTLRAAGITVTVIWVTDSSRDEAEALITRLELAGIRAKRVNPWRNS